MKLTKNTMYPKILKMKTELNIIEQELVNFEKILMLDEEKEFKEKIEEEIKNIPKVEYFDEEMRSIRECMINVHEGYEPKGDAMIYVNFLKKVVENSKE